MTEKMTVKQLQKAAMASGGTPRRFTLHVTQDQLTIALGGCHWVKLISGIFYCPQLGKAYRVEPDPLPFDPNYRKIEAVFE